VDVGRDLVEVGTVATLLGRDGDDRISAEELAAHIGTINYEVTTRIPSRVPRVYLGKDRGLSGPPGGNIAPPHSPLGGERL